MVSSLLFAALLLVASCGVFALGVLRLYRIMARGKVQRPQAHRSNRFTGDIGADLFLSAKRRLASRCPMRLPAGATSKHHLLIFYGFLIITVGHRRVHVTGAFVGHRARL
jgi:hypothetical protein